MTMRESPPTSAAFAGAAASPRKGSPFDDSGKALPREQIQRRLLEERIIFLNADIDDESAQAAIEQILFLNAVDPSKDIHIYINSRGGSISSGNAVLDVMKMVKPDINTYGVGICASMASDILMAGTKGKRFILPRGQVMIHQPSISNLNGQYTDVQIATARCGAMRKHGERMYAHYMDVPYDKKFSALIRAATERDSYMNAYMARRLGVVDKILPYEGKDGKAEAKILMGLFEEDFNAIDMGADDLSPEAPLKALILAREEYRAKPARERRPEQP